MKIATPTTVADVPGWLAQWAETLEENGQLAGAVLRQIAAGLAGQLAAAATPARTAEQIANLNAADTGHNPYATVVERADVDTAGVIPRETAGAVSDTWPIRCVEVKTFARRVRRTDAPSWLHPNDGLAACDCPQCWRDESDLVRCDLAAGHDGMHTGELHGAGCYWQDEPVPSNVVDFAAPYGDADAAAIPTGPACDSHGPYAARCVALYGHDGPCWAPDSRHGRIGWDMPAQPESWHCGGVVPHDPHTAAAGRLCPGRTFPGVPA